MAIRGKIPLSDAILSNDTTFKIKTDSYPSELPFQNKDEVLSVHKAFQNRVQIQSTLQTHFQNGDEVLSVQTVFQNRVSDTVRYPFQTLFQNGDEVLSVQTIFQKPGFRIQSVTLL